MPSQQRKNKTVFFENLDALRALAFGMVFLCHFFGYVSYTSSSPAELFIVDNFFLEGRLGVNLFFVLSGFLITYLMLVEQENTGRIHVGFFYMRRILRIWPLYFIAIIAGFFLYPMATGQYDASSVKEHLPYFLLFINNFDRIFTGFTGIGNDNLGVLWSIAIEEQFYFFWPLILSVVPKKYYSRLFISIILLSFIYRLLNAEHGAILYSHTFSAISDLVVGALLACCCFNKTRLYYQLEQCSRLFIVAVYLLLLLSVLFLQYWTEQNIFTKALGRLEISVLFAFVIGEQCFSKNSILKLGRFKTLSAVGIISYGLYCFHLYGIALVQKINLSLHLEKLPKLLFYVELVLSAGACIFACYISYHYFEKKILTLKYRFMPVNTNS